MENNGWSPDELKNKAQVYCARAEHCESEVREKLRQWGSDSATSDCIVQQLRQNNFINSNRYAEAFVRDKLLHQGWGRRKIELMLRSKNEPSDIIQKALDSIDENEYICILKKVIQKKKGATREQVARFCLQRGFLWEEIEPLL